MSAVNKSRMAFRLIGLHALLDSAVARQCVTGLVVWVSLPSQRVCIVVRHRQVIVLARFPH